MSALLHEKTGARDATASLYDRHHHRIRGYCLGQLRHREEANDAVQSTFLYAFALLRRGVEPHNELPWLFTIAHNVCRTRQRSLRRRSRIEAPVELDMLQEVVGREDPAREEIEELGALVAELPETQRRALLLREWQGLSYAEIATRMGLTESAVEAVLFRARRSLARKLRPVDRVASFLSGLFLLRGLRRFGGLTGSGKVAATVATLGLAATAAVPPLVHSEHPESVHGPPARSHATASPLAVPGAAGPAHAAAPAAVAARGRKSPPPARVHVRAAATETHVAASRAPRLPEAAVSPPSPAVVATQPTAHAPQPPAEPHAATRTVSDAPPSAPAPPAAAATSTAPPTPPAADTTTPAPSRVVELESHLPPPVQHVVQTVVPPSLPPVTVPEPPSLPPPVQDAVQNVVPPTAPDTSGAGTPDLPAVPPPVQDVVQNLVPPLPSVPPPPPLLNGTP